MNPNPNIDFELATYLVKTQMDDLADLRVLAGPTNGTDNVMFRLGPDYGLRFPLKPEAVGQIEKEFKWLPMLSPLLPLAIPEPLRLGKPTEVYPYPWSVVRWIDGENAFELPIQDLNTAAETLGHFVRALRELDSTDGPKPGEHNFGRGVPLGKRDLATRRGIEQLTDLYDTKDLITIWGHTLELPNWTDKPVWIHGDIHIGNLIVHEDRIKAVIDFGGLAVGDPACDLMIAWTLLDADSRQIFKQIVSVDEHTWKRGRAWALSVAVIALPYYLQTNPLLTHISKHAIEHVIADFNMRS